MVDQNIHKDSIESLSHFLNKNLHNPLKPIKIKTDKENIIIEIPDLEVSPILDLFKKAPKEWIGKIDELEGNIVFPKKNATALLHFFRTSIKQPTTPEPNVLHSFNPKQDPTRLAKLSQEKNNEDVNRFLEYSNIKRDKPHTTDHEQTPQFIAKAAHKKLEDLKISLDNYKSQLKNPTSHGYLGGLFGSDQAVKKDIAQHILEKLDNFSKLSLSDPEYMQSKQNLMRDLNAAINKNRKAHGFWASLTGAGKLENILLSAKEALEPSAKQLNKTRLQT